MSFSHVLSWYKNTCQMEPSISYNHHNYEQWWCIVRKPMDEDGDTYDEVVAIVDMRWFVWSKEGKMPLIWKTIKVMCLNY